MQQKRAACPERFDTLRERFFFFLIFRIFQRFATATRKDRTFPVAQASPKPKSFVLFLRFAVVWRRILIPRNFLPAQKPEKRKTSIKTQHV